MNQKKRGLGKGLGEMGLSELLGEAKSTVGADISHEPTPALQEKRHLKDMPVDRLRPGRYQPRKDMNREGLEELANSIRTQGIIQPIVVRSMNDGYEIIAGERRWRAAQMAGLDVVPVIIRDMPDETAIAVALIENIQRRDLNPIEEAVALQRLIDEFSMTHQELSEAVGKSRTVVTNLLRLLKLNSDVRIHVEQGKLEMGHARALLALENDVQSEVAQKIIAKSLSVRQTESLIRDLKTPPISNMPKAPIDPNILSLQKNLSDTLGATVNLQHTHAGRGKLIVHYHSLDELDGILDKMGQSER